MNSTKSLWAGLALTLVCASGASSATLNVAADGTLLGAWGVNIAGISYDVSFQDGVVKDNVSVLHNFPHAGQASTALFSQVLLGDYNTLAKPIRGCSDTVRCAIWTPVDVGGSFVQTINLAGAGDFTATYSAGTYATTDTAIYSNVTLAVWSAAAPVPENASWALLMAGLGFVSMVRRTRPA